MKGQKSEPRRHEDTKEKQKGKMRAFHVWYGGDEGDAWSSLIIESSASKAKARFFRFWKEELGGEWRGLKCKREPLFDDLAGGDQSFFDGCDNNPPEFWARFADNDY